METWTRTHTCTRVYVNVPYTVSVIISYMFRHVQSDVLEIWHQLQQYVNKIFIYLFIYTIQNGGYYFYLQTLVLTEIFYRFY